ncbi:STAS domain-containing protein [Nonomuraea sp. NPDC050783]|uniref:STAS domain-containing protein n=1 Tax=Nonomuraea sp. NPDC050783 TaxID=3154634 RepID=UPI003466FF54
MSWRGPRLRAETGSSESCLVVRLSGDLDFISAPGFREWMTAVVATGHGDGGGSAAGRFVLDLGGLEFFDSSGLAVVIALWKQVRDAGHDLAVACPPPICAIMMHRTGLAEHIAMGDTVAEAAALLRVSRPVPGAAGQVQAG